jgi:adenylate cyclase
MDATQLDRAELERLGVYEPDAPDAEDRLRLLAYLLDRGASSEDLVRAFRSGGLGALALELALREGDEPVPFERARESAGLDPEAASALWRALGFPEPDASLPLSAIEAGALRTLADAGGSLFGRPATVGLARVIGAGAARLSDAIVEAVRVQVEVPRVRAGVEYSKVVAEYCELAQNQLDAFVAVFEAAFRRHLVMVASAGWSFDEEASAARHELTVCFVDMEGYTALSRTLSGRELAELVSRFETIVTDVVSRHGARLIKLIGDAAMIVSEDADAGCALALETIERFDEDPDLPAVRAGLANGPVMALRGDYFGEVVNLASRLAGVGQPSSATVDDAVRQLAGGAFDFTALPPTELKGLARPPAAYRLLASGSRPEPGMAGGR